MKQQIQNNQIPKGWKEQNFEDVFKIFGGDAAPKGEELGGEIDFVRMQDLGRVGNSIYINNVKDSVSEKIIQSKKLKTFKAGSILIPRSGSVHLNHRAILKKDSCVVSHIAILENKNTENSNLFLYYLLKTIDMKQIMHQTTGLNLIRFEDLKQLRLIIPPMETQQQIVQEIETQFTRLDAAVKSLKKVKEKLEVYRKAVLNQLFYGDKKTFPEIISKEKNSMKRGPFGGSLKKDIFVSSGYLIYEQHHPINNNFNFGRYFITKEKFEEMKNFSVKPGDLLISCSGTIGKIAEIPKENFKEGIINQALLKITLDNSKVLNKYFLFLFQSQYIQKHLIKISRGVAIKNVPSVKELKTIKFPIPTIQEQQQIVQEIESKFSVIDKVEEVVNNSLKKAERLRKSILKSAFEGRLVKEE